MRHDPRKYLWDALQAAQLLADFGRGKSLDDYLSDAMLRSAVDGSSKSSARRSTSFPAKTRKLPRRSRTCLESCRSATF